MHAGIQEDQGRPYNLAGLLGALTSQPHTGFAMKELQQSSQANQPRLETTILFW